MLRTALRRTKEVMLAKHARVMTAARDPRPRTDYTRLTLGVGMAALLAGMSTVTLADDSEEKGPENPLKKLVREEFQIPQMIAEREARK